MKTTPAQDFMKKVNEIYNAAIAEAAEKNVKLTARHKKNIMDNAWAGIRTKIV